MRIKSNKAQQGRQVSLTDPYLTLFGLIDPYLGQTRGTCAQAHEKELLECGTKLSVQLPALPKGFPSRDHVAR